MESKLKELGYSKLSPKHYIKQINGSCSNHIIIDECGKAINSFLFRPFGFSTQKDIDALQIAFNNLQRDIKELENEKI